MNSPRKWHTATLLQDGKVLVAGGCSGADCHAASLASAEIYDPRFGYLDDYRVNEQRKGSYILRHIAASGEVLVAGGTKDHQLAGYDFDHTSLNTAELYDPISGTWE